MFTVDPKSPLPIYEQLVAQIIRSIARGLLRSGEQMPSVRELAGTLLVNPNTVSRAYQELESRNFIVTMRGKGSFISDIPLHEVKKAAIQDPLIRLCSVADELSISNEELYQLILHIREDSSC
ncbi:MULTISPECIES: GntR family transcriptional regulator [Exiguobacterium]|jgi:GntR family transcriptional regulator|uniref:GntR family transcriptional regulator n=1 Tax=Exiguobacterium TaxID=33986 RepID=UPI00044930DA|nr:MULTISPECIES: GntR family transcriptional regulator [Exiguobacterium]EZP59761.1 GntR family transcriptional regulator [Exiguobacterium sp. RIT341]KQS37421.1 GntR family transcriptional regulator [Exiguobacterium sp. Leaf196]MDQ6467932.1 GntR family transcriptional regulator [Exiguobacterium acetylicum]MDT0172844.1 GntR family transcriptional regulator [Exiguobacterium sp. BRG2]HAB33258.1 GntR family transcriptional regulator [Exiguobacterium sp.]